MSTRHRRSGFSLVEIVVVLALLGLMAVAAAPMMAVSVPRDPLVSASDSIVALLERGRVTALQAGQPVTITIEPATRRWWVDTPDTSGVLTLPDGAEIVSDAPRLSFAFGASGPAIGNPLVVRVGGATRIIRIDAWTGRIDARAGGTDALR